MFTLVGLLVVFGVIVIVISRRVSGLRALTILGQSVLVAVASWVIWSVLVMGGFVRVDPLLRWLGGDDPDQHWVALVLLGPPIFAAIAFGLRALAAKGAGRHRENR